MEAMNASLPQAAPSNETLDRTRTQTKNYCYGPNGHKELKMTAQQREVLQEYGHLISQSNQDLLLIPAWDMAKNAYGPCKPSSNEYCINSQLSLKSKSYGPVGRDNYNLRTESFYPRQK